MMLCISQFIYGHIILKILIKEKNGKFNVIMFSKIEICSQVNTSFISYIELAMVILFCILNFMNVLNLYSHFY